MCGLVAVFSNDSINPNVIDGALDCMFARGPDDGGTWSSDGVIFGHRRLAVIDLDKRATQPMSSFDDRYVIVFNGEIYNYEILKIRLLEKGFTFKTSSDTEVLLAMYQEYGQEMLSKLEGMFSFVIWDKLTRIGFAARDPYGIKPLYIGSFDNGFVFASQVKAVLATNLISKDIDLDAQQLFWMLGSVPEPYTWFRKIQSLGSGQCAHISSTMQLTIETWLDIGLYWRSSDEIIDFTSLEHIQDAVKRCLKESVNRHLVADVSVGLLLSGGIDSGALAGLMVDEIGADKVTGITISFDEFAGDAKDEVPAAKEIARFYKIKHIIKKVTRAEFLKDLPEILNAIDQPSIDGVNTWYACKAASEARLKVVLSGVGGDELFLGYRSFQRLPKIVSYYRRLLQLPFIYPLAKLLALFLAKKTHNTRWLYAPDWLKTIVGAWWLHRSFSSPLDLMELIGNDAGINFIKRPYDVNAQVCKMTGKLPEAPELALAQIETMSYLRNQLLRDADWASMSHSVELRTPLVDEKLLRSIAPLMPYLKYFPGKILLANAPNKPLPASISSRLKTGFSIPILEWLSEDRKTKFIGKRDRWSWARKVVRSYEASLAS